MKARNLLLPLVFVALAIFIFPLSSPGSSVFYASSSFFLVALLLSSLGKSLECGISYLRMIPQRKQALRLAAWGAAALAASVAITAAVSVALGYLGYLDSDLVAQKVAGLPAAALVAAFTLAPVGEEALFRGYLFRKISEKAGSWHVGAIASSLIFAALHFAYGSVAEIAVAFLVGLSFCAFTQKTRSLFPAIAAHASFNLLSIAYTVFF